MYAIEDYARKWAKREKEQVWTLSEWLTSIKSLVLSRNSHLKEVMGTNANSIFNDQSVAETMSDLHEQYMIVPADTALNNVVFIYETKTIHWLLDL